MGLKLENYIPLPFGVKTRVLHAIHLYLLHELAELQSYKYKERYKWWHIEQRTR